MKPINNLQVFGAKEDSQIQSINQIQSLIPPKSANDNRTLFRYHHPQTSITTKGEVQFYTPRENQSNINKLTSPRPSHIKNDKFIQIQNQQKNLQNESAKTSYAENNLYNQKSKPENEKLKNTNKLNKTQNQLDKVQIEQNNKSNNIESEMFLKDEHLEIQGMGGGPGIIMKTTQYLSQIKQGNHQPLRQLSAIQSSLSSRQVNTEQSDGQISHYFTINNNIQKGLNTSQRNSQVKNDKFILKKVKTTDKLYTENDQTKSLSSSQFDSSKKTQAPSSLVFDEKRPESSLERGNIPKMHMEQVKQSQSHAMLSRFNSGKMNEQNNKIPKFKISTECATTFENSYLTQRGDRLNTDDLFNTVSIGQNQQSPILKKQSIEKNILLGQYKNNLSNRQSKTIPSSQNEINLFERKPSNNDQLLRNNSITNNQIQNSNTKPTVNNFIIQQNQYNSLLKRAQNNNISQFANQNDISNYKNLSPPQQSKDQSPEKSLYNFSPNKFHKMLSSGSNLGTTTHQNVSITKQMCLAATDFQYQKQVREQENQQKKLRFGVEMFNSFQQEIDRLKRQYKNKQEIEPILTHYKQSQDICYKTKQTVLKCLNVKKNRAPLEALLTQLSEYVGNFKQHANLQLFILLQISKILIEINSPLIAIPILKLVKRQSFLNILNPYLMKAYRSLAYCFISIQKYEIAFGYAAKYLHQTWVCDCHNNEINANELLGKIFFYLGDGKKSSYFHNRMALNIREDENSSLRKMLIDNLKTIQKRRYEIQAVRDVKKNRKKFEERKNDDSLFIISSDDEHDLNLLIPEENKDLMEENRAQMENTLKKLNKVGPITMDTIMNMSKLNAPLRKMPKFNIKTDKGFLEDAYCRGNQDIRIEQIKKEKFEQFLKKPLEQFIQFKGMHNIGPMRDKLLFSHNSFTKNPSDYQLNWNRNTKQINLLTSSNDLTERDINSNNIEQYKVISNSKFDIEMDIKNNEGSTEVWTEQTIDIIEKALTKIIKNIDQLVVQRDELRETHEEKIRNKTFFEIIKNDNQSSEHEKMMKKILESKNENQEKFWIHIV